MQPETTALGRRDALPRRGRPIRSNLAELDDCRRAMLAEAGARGKFSRGALKPSKTFSWPGSRVEGYARPRKGQQSFRHSAGPDSNV